MAINIGTNVGIIGYFSQNNEVVQTEVWNGIFWSKIIRKRPIRPTMYSSQGETLKRFCLLNRVSRLEVHEQAPEYPEWGMVVTTNVLNFMQIL